MIDLLNFLTTFAAAAIGLPIAVVFVECCAALWPRRKSPPATQRPSLDVLIPAHNEEAVVAATLESVRAQLRPGDRLTVVADNCRDRTAAAARACGAEVVERFDSVRRGKGYALDFGLTCLASDHREAVVVVDADCRLGFGTLDALAQAVACTGRPVQANYVMTCPPSPSPRDVVSQFAVTVKNQVRLRGLTMLGGPCVLTGSGMAFPWAVIRNAKLASGNIVEDMQLSFDLLMVGHAPVFCPAAEVFAPLPKQRQASLSQRTRWEHGHLQTLLERVPKLLLHGLRRRKWAHLVAAFDLGVPPLALLVAGWSAILAVAIVAIQCGFGQRTLWIEAVSGILLLTAMLIAHFGFSRGGSFFSLVAAVPRYIVGKLPIYASFLFRRQTTWVRTDREAAPKPNRLTTEPTP